MQSSVGGVAANATLVLHFNNTGSVVNEELLVGDDRIKIIFGSADNVFSISLLGSILNLGGVITIEGSLTYKSQGGYKVLGAENMTLFVGEGQLRLDNGELNPFAKGLMISEATVGLVKQGEGDATKYALSAEGQVSVVGISGLSLSGPISISYNGFDQLIEQTVAIVGTTKQVAVKYTEAQVSKVVNGVKESFYEIKGFETPIAIDVAGQRVRANFSVRRFASVGGDKDDSLEFGLTNVEASFGDGASNFVTLSGGSGALLSMPDGVALEASGTVSVSAPQVSLSGTMDLKINNVGVAVNQGSVNLEAGPYTKFEGTGLELKVAGQTLSGDFSFEKEANGDVRGAVTNGALKIKSGDKELIDLSQISGGFEMSSEGSYGALQVGGSTFTVPGVSVKWRDCDGADKYGG